MTEHTGPPESVPPLRRRSLMGRVILTRPTGDRETDLVLRGIVAVFEEVFGDRIRGYYLFGSRQGGGGVETSDIDMIVVFKGRLAPGEPERALRLALFCSDMSPIPITVDPIGEEEIRPGDIRFLYFSTPVYGDDIRGRIPTPSLEAYTWETTGWFHHYSGLQVRQLEVLIYPLTYPDTQDRYLGYATRNYLSLRRPIVVARTKMLTSVVFNIAAGLMAIQAGVWTANWSLVPNQYREHIGDEWTDLVTDVFGYCKQRWQYLVPDDPEDVARLQEICRRTLGFENHFCRVYRRFLLERLQGNEVQRLQAVRRLSSIVYPDEEVESALRRTLSHADPGLSQAVRAALNSRETLAGGAVTAG